MPKKTVIRAQIDVDEKGLFESRWSMSKIAPDVVTLTALALLCNGGGLLMADIARRSGRTADDIERLLKSLLESLEVEPAADGKPAAAAGMTSMRISLN